MRVDMKNRLHWYGINRTRPRHGYEYAKYKMCLFMVMVMFNEKHLSINWSWIQERVKQHWGWVKKYVYCKTSMYSGRYCKR